MCLRILRGSLCWEWRAWGLCTPFKYGRKSWFPTAGEGACSWHMPESPSGLPALNNGLLLAAGVGVGVCQSQSGCVCVSIQGPTKRHRCGGGVGLSLFSSATTSSQPRQAELGPGYGLTGSGHLAVSWCRYRPGWNSLCLIWVGGPIHRSGPQDLHNIVLLEKNGADPCLYLLVGGSLGQQVCRHLERRQGHRPGCRGQLQPWSCQGQDPAGRGGLKPYQLAQP